MAAGGGRRADFAFFATATHFLQQRHTTPSHIYSASGEVHTNYAVYFYVLLLYFYVLLLFASSYEPII